MTFTALHRLLGLTPGPITDEMIDAAVTAGITETADLDWKSELPPIKALSQSDFPKDIAAMANNGGGIIVYGIDEDEKAATGRRNVDLTEQHERALRSAAVTAISPPVFGLGIHQIGTSGNQVVAIVVGASVDGPHLIYKNDYFGAPIRNDADTVWMKERHIELMYRARFDERRNSTEALDTLYTEQTAGRDTAKRAWLIAVAHPRLPASTMTRPTREQATSMFTVADAHTYTARGHSPLGAVRRHDPRPGLRRWIAPNIRDPDSTRWSEAWASIHHNGAVTIAASVGGQIGYPHDLAGDHIDSATVEYSVADFMSLIRVAGEHFGTNEYEAQVGIEWTGGSPLIIQTVDQMGRPFLDNSLAIARYSPITTTVRSGADDADYLQQIRTLAEDCINQGGITGLRAIRANEPNL
ncbi:AlbA family DNA-binding domain-containing protein [Rhodococcus qingshengii]|uniref:AlbA family DNA-binding domain-containing protein n=1 Tax=Rhodococcus qingshengii TaxID=334542 RepID=UPI001C8C3952|nr:ATP-binding protein [Rhodococcus qingshengii]MBX9152250.1 ATP-binding protein [Rhodococcus qingshengii]